MKRRALVIALVVLVLATSVWALARRAPRTPHRSLAQAVAVYGPSARARLRPHFDQAAVPYPPSDVTLLALKQERRVELFALHGGKQTLVRSYPVLAASGSAGPKLREGDRQVPEGIYRVIGLNPNSHYHLSMELDYPNAFDRARASDEGRSGLGGEIFIHGNSVSAGCLAMGDTAIEDLFTLVADVGTSHVRVIIAPNDLRGGQPPVLPSSAPAWLGSLHNQLRTEMRSLDPSR